jgi:hypothetical protein
MGQPHWQDHHRGGRHRILERNHGRVRPGAYRGRTRPQPLVHRSGRQPHRKITTSGVVTEYAPMSRSGTRPWGIAAGPDGNLWFVERTGGRFANLGRITPSGVVTEYPAGLGVRVLLIGIAAGADGNMWFTDQQSGRIGRITTGASVDTSRPAVSNVALVGGGRTAGRAARSKSVIHPTRVRFRLSEPALVTVRVERRVGRRWRTVHSHALSHSAGRSTRTLHRRVRPRALAKGSYRAHVSALDLAGGNRSRAHSRPFVDLCTGRCVAVVGGAR